MIREQAVADSTLSSEAQEGIWDAFRRWGYLQARLDPLGELEPVAMPELDVSGPEADGAAINGRRAPAGASP
jgi:2-oxoglutarate dehydrogenase E1 component